MVKIFVGNLPQAATEDELRQLFAEYGAVTECSIVKNFGFVHMEDRKAATKAIRSLHMHMLHGTPINVEASHGKNQSPVKLHVSNVEKGCDAQLRALFEEYGTVTECAVVKNFAFVHMPNYEEAMDAMRGLDNTLIQEKRIHVQVSKSRPKYDESEEYPPPPPDRGSYWPPQYPGERPAPPPPSYMRGRAMPPGYPAPPPPPLPPPLPRRAVYPQHYESDGYSMVDYYEKYRARPYGVSPYEGQRTGPPPPPPPPSAVVRGRPLSSSLDPYERRPLPPPLTPHPSAYYARDRSPIGRAPAAPMPPPSNGYSYDRSAYGVPRARDPYANRLPPPPPPRYAY
ncbi:RNA-binding protein 4.1 [Nematolebias whitei]|uniref:RNA-binding protein 4.1 n=1 Tax=Nematolebias whitei TaxID=451745 RepID=UPI001898E79B|nr:RNA-binding protein 4.1 [Nematolebias whitei]XP_037530989.1 RNA-binding protein 4.1 [Nematolebias whitei]XP_037530990.1 RNA-binding protein 4.1 [Nematolebias whitei]